MTVQIFTAAQRSPIDLAYDPSPLGMDIDFQITASSLVTTYLIALICHKGILNAFGRDDYPIGAGVKLGLRGPIAAQADLASATVSFMGRRTGQNINGVKEHYYSCSMLFPKVFTQTGWYRISAYGNAQTDSDGL